MSDNRSRRRLRTCPHCGETYVLTNFMVRRFDFEGKPVAPGQTYERKSDTHVIACARRHPVITAS